MSIHKQLFCLSGSGYAEFVIVFVAVVVICIVVVKASVVGGGGGDEQGEQTESEKNRIWPMDQFSFINQIPVFQLNASNIVLFSI